jgi:hypothetical protein
VTLRLAVLAAALSLHTTAQAAESASATELSRLLVPKQAWAEGIGQIAQQVQGQMQMHPGAKLEYPPDFAKSVRAEVEGAVPYEETVGLNAKELQAAFSEAELKDVLGFFKSPVGQKWLDTAGKVQMKAGMEADKRLQQKMPEIMTRLADLVKAPAGAKAPQGHPAMSGMGGEKKPAAAPPAKKAEPAAKK